MAHKEAYLFCSSKGIADEQLAKAEQERGRKRERTSEEPEAAGASKRIRSASVSSTISVSTISTNMTRSQSPRRSNSGGKRRLGSPSLSQSPFPNDSSRQDRRFPSVSRSPPSQPKAMDREKKRRRSSFSSVDSISSDDRRDNRRDSRRRDSSRSTRRRYQHMSPPMRGRRTESTSPKREARRIPSDRDPSREDFGNGGGSHRNDFKDHQPPARERSLSPFSKRLALTQSMNMGR
ncbi:uncharacterized protein BP5553_05314 [Venustampulla echinocandica]|uniref:Uncharacterized protein n=1 Tax=Venustampulla echinocandica TaxID=2656787 RepID=A0A370TQT3_9HELO|nr:uncharacterized protein BP5553_05314 [Venustampulla echinocandica]RDL37881.1 hypothetical protein BP5553_05314 [Venustampulla echinocandica]